MTEPVLPDPQISLAAGPAPARRADKVVFYRRGWFIGVVSGVLGFGLATALFLPGSDDNDTASSSSESTTSDDSDGTDESEPAEDETEAVTLTDEDDSGGLALKLTKVTREDSITYEGGTQSSLTPDGDPVTTKAADGGYYLVVGTDGKNGTKEPIDLTCSLPLEIVVFDDDGAKYSTIEGLDQIKGNPGCNDMVQPGQKFKEKFIFLLPAGAEPDQLVWQSINAELESAESAGIDLADY